MGRILAIDYGTRRTGIAVSDPLRIIAGALTTVETRQLEKFLADYFSKNDVDTIVLGKPVQMNGSPSETMRYIEPLAARLRRTYPDKDVVLYDERFTSVLAHRTMIESGMGRMARGRGPHLGRHNTAIIHGVAIHETIKREIRL